MDSFFKQLDKGLDSIAGKLEKMERKWNEGGGGAGEEGVGDTYSINNSRYRIVKKLAEGGFAFVYLAEQVETGRPVALKRILVQDDEHLEIIRREINFLKTLSGKEGIIPFLGAASFKKPNRHEVIVLTEYCPRGSVLNLMYQRERNRMTETEILFIFETVCKAVYHMHCMDPPIAHRDLKVENVLVGKNGSLYLIDFGSATVVTYDTDKPHIRNIAENDINRNTTLLYRAPEMVDLYRKQIINEKCDVWALGCMLYKMMYYADPFDGKLGILNARYRAPDFPPYTPKMHDLLRYLLTADPEKRPDICDVLEKLGSPMPRVHRKSAPAREASPSTGRENGSGAGGAKDLFAMLDWQKNDGSSPSSTQRSSAREARSQSPSVPNGGSSSVGSQSLIDDFEQKVSISGSSTTTTSASSNGQDDFFANFDAVARQPSPTPAVGSGSTATTSHNNNNNDDGWGDFSTFSSSSSSSSTSSSSMPAAPAAFGLESLMGAASPASLSPAPAARPQPEKKDILSLYGTDASSPATPGLFGSHGSPYGSGTASPVPGQTYNSLPMGGMPMGVVYAAAPAGTPVYMMAAPQAAVGLGSPMTSPLYARAPTPSYGSGPSPLVPHVGGGGGLTPVSTPPLTPISARSASPLSSSSATGASAQGPASGGDPFAALWNTASK